MARIRPGSPAALLGIRGVGERKLADLGSRFLELIATYCRANGLPLDAALGSRPRRERVRKPNDAKETAFELFAKGASVEQVTTRTGRALGTTWGYLAEFIQISLPGEIGSVDRSKDIPLGCRRGEELGTAYLQPVFDRLDGKVPYEQIRARRRASQYARDTRTKSQDT